MATFAAAIRRGRSSPLADRGALFLFVALMLVNCTSLLFHVIVSRHLAPASYGALGPLLAILLILAVPASALQVTITREVAARRGAANQDQDTPIVVGPLLAEAVVVGCLGALILAALAPVLSSFLHLPGLRPVFMLSAYLVPAAIGLVPKAVLLGELRFRRVGVGLVAGATARVILSYFMVRVGDGVSGAMAATVLGEVVTAAVLLPGLRQVIHAKVPTASPLVVRWFDAQSAVAAFSGFWLLNTIDTLLARHFLSGSASGYYVAASTAAGAAMFLPGTVSTIAFPRFAEHRGVGPRARTALMQSLLAVALLSACAAGTVLIAPSLVIRLFFGNAYAPSTAIVGILAISAGLVGLVNVLMHFHIARGDLPGSVACWIGVIAAVVGIVLVHSTPERIALVILAGAGSVFVVMLFRALRRDAEREPAPESFVGRELWDLREPDLDVTIVVPYYNPGDRLRANIERVIEVLEASAVTFEVVAVSDGSTDGSDVAIEEIGHGALRRVGLARNSGKGQALRVGLAMGRGRYLGFIDADGDLPPDLLEPFLEIVRVYEPDIVLGSKRHPMSEVSYPPIRRLYSWSYQQMTRVLFRLNIRDSQTGLKLVRRDVLAQVLPRMLEKRFAFDLELFVVARHLGYRRFFEAPVRLKHQFTSTISLGSVRGMILDTLAIFYRLRLVRYYDRPQHDATGRAAIDVPTLDGGIVTASASD